MKFGTVIFIDSCRARASFPENRLCDSRTLLEALNEVSSVFCTFFLSFDSDKIPYRRYPQFFLGGGAIVIFRENSFS